MRLFVLLRVPAAAADAYQLDTESTGKQCLFHYVTTVPWIYHQNFTLGQQQLIDQKKIINNENDQQQNPLLISLVCAMCRDHLCH